MRKKSSWYVLILALALVFGVEFTASAFTFSSVKSWYPTLVHPPWTPPSWMFGPVWTLLYFTMALALFFAWRAGVSWLGVFAWLVQLGFNFAWSFLFFLLQNPPLALIDLFMILAALGWTVILFFQVSKLAGWLLIPYLLWTCYALSLNAAIIVLNR